MKQPSNRVRTSDPPGPAPGRPKRNSGHGRLLACFPIAATLAAAVLAGCGGSSPGDSVAHIKTSTTANRASNTTGDNGSTAKASGVAYSQCVRSHGVPNFPDPNSQGDFSYNGPPSPALQAATKDCKSLLPTNKVSAAQENAEFTKSLKAAACIRANGYPSFPGPKIVNGNIGITLANNNIDVNSPAFQRVAKKCGAPAGLV